MKSIVLFFLLVLTTFPVHAQVLYQSDFSVNSDHWYTAKSDGYGDPHPQNKVALDWDSRGWVRSWSVGEIRWWPDGDQSCYNPFFAILLIS